MKEKRKTQLYPALKIASFISLMALISMWGINYSTLFNLYDKEGANFYEFLFCCLIFNHIGMHRIVDYLWGNIQAAYFWIPIMDAFGTFVILFIFTFWWKTRLTRGDHESNN